MDTGQAQMPSQLGLRKGLLTVAAEGDAFESLPEEIAMPPNACALSSGSLRVTVICFQTNTASGASVRKIGLLARPERWVGGPGLGVVGPTTAAVVAEGDEQQDAEEEEAGNAEEFGELRGVADAHEDPGDEGGFGERDGEGDDDVPFAEVEGSDFGGNGGAGNQGDENLDEGAHFGDVYVMCFCV